MTIGEVIEMLMKIFEYLSEYLGGLFASQEDEGTADEEAAA